ncbi:MAG TPA: hypothetical protein VGL56_14300 [Fimbriimonadaceae bacterium]|jgi:hypothetical protein
MMLKNLIRHVAVVLAAVGILAAAQAQEKFHLKVLYAGVQNDARTPEFMDFLQQHFDKVGFAPYSEFKPEMADGYNVVIFDAAAHPTALRIGLPKAPVLPPTYDRATLLISGGGIMVAENLKLKLDWL